MKEVLGFEFDVPKAFAVNLFEQHLLPHLDKFNDLEKTMAIDFLKDPEKTIPEIVKRYKIESFDQLVDLLNSPETPESAKAFLRTIKEALEERGMWRFNTFSFKRKFLPEMPSDLFEFKEIKKCLEDLKKKKATKILRTEVLSARKVTRGGRELYIYRKLASKALGREVKEGERLNFEEAYKVIEWLYDYWKNLGILDAEQKGWIYEDGWGVKHWIWKRWIGVGTDVVDSSPEEAQNLKKIREYLVELKQKGAEKFLRIRKSKEDEGIHWFEDTLYVPEKLLGEKKGRKARLEKVMEVINDLLKNYEEWKKKGLLYEDKDGRERFIWDREIGASATEELVPFSPEDVENLKKIKEYLEELKQKGTENSLVIVVSSPECTASFSWMNNKLRINGKLASEALDREVKEGEELNFEDALKAIDYLLPKWQELLEEAEEKGWIWEDRFGHRYFLWAGPLLLTFQKIWWEEDKPWAEKLKEILEKLKESGKEKYLKIIVRWQGGINKYENRLEIAKWLVEEALGKKVEPGEELNIEEAIKVLDFFLKNWRSFLFPFSFSF